MCTRRPAPRRTPRRDSQLQSALPSDALNLVPGSNLAKGLRRFCHIWYTVIKALGKQVLKTIQTTAIAPQENWFTCFMMVLHSYQQSGNLGDYGYSANTGGWDGANNPIHPLGLCS